MRWYRFKPPDPIGPVYSGSAGPNRPMYGTPSDAARCNGPESPPMNNAACESRGTKSSRFEASKISILFPSLFAASRTSGTDSTLFNCFSSTPAPIRTTAFSPASACASDKNRPIPHSRYFHPAKGCITIISRLVVCAGFQKTETCLFFHILGNVPFDPIVKRDPERFTNLSRPVRNVFPVIWLDLAELQPDAGNFWMIQKRRQRFRRLRDIQF